MSVTTAAPASPRRAKAPKINRAECSQAARALLGAFDWSRTEEGHAYWSAIHTRLLKLAGKKS